MINPIAPVTVNDGQPVTIAGSFIDPGPDATWTVSIDWGDSSPVDTFNANNNRTFSHQRTYAAAGSYTATVTVTDKDGGVSAPLNVNVLVQATTFQVSSTTLNASGVDFTFNRPVQLGLLNLYHGQLVTDTTQDVTLAGQVTGAVRGSLVYNSNTGVFSFVKSGGVLAGDVYTLTIQSGADGFVATNGDFLDGNANGTAGDDSVQVLNVTAPTGPVLSIGDFARGPGQAVNINAADLGSLLPVMINTPVAVSSINFQVLYDPNLLDIPATGAVTLGADVPVGWQVAYSVSSGVLTVSLTQPGSFGDIPTGLKELVRINATVPTGASYADAQVLKFANIVVNGSSAITAARWRARSDRLPSAIDCNRQASRLQRKSLLPVRVASPKTARYFSRSSAGDIRRSAATSIFTFWTIV